MTDQRRLREDIHNSDVPLLCRSCEARHKGVCGALTPEQLIHLSKHTTRKAVERETELVQIGEDVTQFSNILGGVVKLTKLMSDGRQQIVGLQFAPDFVGRPFASQSNITAEAATTIRICSFPKAILEEIISQSPELEHRLHEQSLRELDEARDWLLTLGRKTASEKVASFLCLIADHIDPEAEQDGHAANFDLPLKRADIADFLGLTIETVSRQITKLRKEGVIAVENNRHITVPDMGLLRAAATPDD
ncbi:MAG: Crp/Fnr family transcriptional regulator [Pseudomonadota bacterium]